jgi:hypothetical protein
MTLVFTLIVGGMSIAPAFGDNDGHKGKGHQKHGRYEHDRRGHQSGPGYYPAPVVYAPPPVVYVPEPYQSPGISLVVPIQIR